MSNTVLIARPHPFIVSAMKPFLEELGFTTAKLERVGELAALAPRATGTVISLALSSPIPESAEEVFSQLRRAATRVPVLFASMLDIGQATAALQQIARRHDFPASILGAKTPATAWASLGRQETFVYLSKEDLEARDRREILAQMVRRHFH